MSTAKDYRIKETIHADGQSSWFVEHNNGREDYAPEHRWKKTCTCETYKVAVRYIKERRAETVVAVKYHEVP